MGSDRLALRELTLEEVLWIKLMRTRAQHAAEGKGCEKMRDHLVAKYGKRHVAEAEMSGRMLIKADRRFLHPIAMKEAIMGYGYAVGIADYVALHYIRQSK